MKEQEEAQLLESPVNRKAFDPPSGFPQQWSISDPKAGITEIAKTRQPADGAHAPFEGKDLDRG
ncbi:MAG: hypothetical protein P4L51_23705 [Puia sp.]|nr:hypothetical protein [Puia sp.]